MTPANGDRPADQIEILFAELLNQLVEIDRRHRIVFDSDDRVVFRVQMPKVVKRIIGVVPEKRAFRDVRKADLHEIVFAIQIKLGDFVRIDRKEDQLTFTKEAEGALVPVLLEKYGDLNSGSQLAAKAGRGGTAGKSSRDFGTSPLLDRGNGTK